MGLQSVRKWNHVYQKGCAVSFPISPARVYGNICRYLSPAQNRVEIVRAVVLFMVILGYCGPFLFPETARSESRSLTKGIEAYKKDNYDDAIRLLERARNEDPSSSAGPFSWS